MRRRFSLSTGAAIPAARATLLPTGLALAAAASLLLLLLAAVPAPAGARTLGPEVLLDPDTEADDPNQVAVAWNGSEYLVAYTVRDEMELRTRRVNAAGHAIGSPVTILVAPNPGYISNLDLEWWDTEWLLVYQWWTSNNGTDVWGQRLDGTGNNLGSPIAIARTTAWERAPRIAIVPGTSLALCAWSQHSAESELTGTIYVSRIANPSGALDVPGIRVSPIGFGCWQADVTFLPGVHLVAYYTNDPWEPVRFTRVEPILGGILGSIGEQLANGDGTTPHWEASPLRVATDELDFVCVWEDGTGIAERFLEARAVGWNGTLLGVEQQLTASNGTAMSPGLAWQGAHYVLHWTDAQVTSVMGTMFVGILDPLAVPQGPATVGPVGFPGADLAAGAAGECLQVYVHRDSDVGNDVAGFRIGASGAIVSGPEVLIADHRTHGPPSVASDGRRFAVAYDETPAAGDTEIRLILLDDTAAILNNQLVTNDAWPERGAHVDAAGLGALGSGYLVTFERDWSGIARIYGSRIDSLGGVRDLGGKEWAAGGTVALKEPRVAGRTSAPHAVVYTYKRAGSSEVRLTYLDDGANPLATHAASTEAGAAQPDIAVAGTRFLVVWERPGLSGDRDIAGRRFGLAGPIDASPLELGAGADDQFGAKVAFDGQRFLVTWTAPDPTGDWVVRGRWVGGDGSVEGPVDGFDVATFAGPAGFNNHNNSELAFDGWRYLVATHITPGPPPTEDDATAAFGMFATWGVPLWSSELGATWFTSRPGVASLGDGRSLFAYRLSKEVSWTGARIAVRTFEDLGGTAVPGTGAEAAGNAAALRLFIAPNPSRRSAGLTFTLSRESEVTLSLWDVAGRRVRRMPPQRYRAGAHAWTWDGRDDSGRAVAAGVYLARISGDGKTAVAKVSLVR